MAHGRKIAVIGLGYVGLPVAVAFARSGAPVIGFDIDRARLDELRAAMTERAKSSPATSSSRACVTSTMPSALAAADFYIVTVPTPIDEREPA